MRTEHRDEIDPRLRNSRNIMSQDEVTGEECYGKDDSRSVRISGEDVSASN